MSESYKPLGAADTVATGAGSDITVTSGKQWIVSAIWIANTSGSDRTCQVKADGHVIIPPVTIPAGGHYPILQPGLTLDTGDILNFVASASSAIVATVWGSEITP